uniref:Uncharacterized protein n=1 Tax=Tanacetum cinerariifolium TaxID=118510 RepID=A0A699GSX0_TANCI|nr:hypothetical protein [Tanacetum cinerariifolium]
MDSSVNDDTTAQPTEVIATSSSLTTSLTAKMDTFTVGLNEDIGSSIDPLTTIVGHHNANPVHSDGYLSSKSDDKVEPVENEIANLLASKGVRYGKKSLWEQWRVTSVDDEYDPYDDDM